MSQVNKCIWIQIKYAACACLFCNWPHNLKCMVTFLYTKWKILHLCLPVYFYICLICWRDLIYSLYPKKKNANSNDDILERKMYNFSKLHHYKNFLNNFLNNSQTKKHFLFVYTNILSFYFLCVFFSMVSILKSEGLMFHKYIKLYIMYHQLLRLKCWKVIKHYICNFTKSSPMKVHSSFCEIIVLVSDKEKRNYIAKYAHTDHF